MENRRKFIHILLVIFFLSLTTITISHAGSSALTKYDKGAFDIVMSVDYTPDANGKTNIEAFLNITAGDIFQMTEGTHHIRRFYIYTPDRDTGAPRQWDKADIRFKSTPNAVVGYAQLNGFMKSGQYIYIDEDLKPIGNIADTGNAIAHEMGHYIYGLYDEYKVDRGLANELIDKQPHKNDNPKDTIMNDMNLFQRLSISDDYPIGARNTAQWRMYEESAWGILTQPPHLDSLWSFFKSSYLGIKNERYHFTDLDALIEPFSVAGLTQPTNGPAPEIIWMEGSEACIIIDRSGSMTSNGKIEQAKSGAKSYLDKLKVAGSNRDYAAVVRFSDSVVTVKALTQLTETIKNEFKAAIDTISANGGTAIGSSLRSGLNILSASTRKGTFKYIVLLTDGQNTSGESPTGAILTELKNANIPVYCIGLGSGADMATLSQIARSTNGKSYFASSGSTLNSVYSDIQSHVADDVLVSWERENLNLSRNNMSTTVTVDVSANTVVFSAAYPIDETATMNLTDPFGNVVMDGDPGVSCENENGYISCRINNPDAGDWEQRIEITSFDVGDEAEVILEAKTNSDFRAQVEVTGGTYPEPIVIQATASRDLPITGLTPTCKFIHTASGSTQTTGTVDLHDDGMPPDKEADDGFYTGVLVDYQNGEYDLNVMFVNPDGNNASEVGTSFVAAFGDLPVPVPVTTAFSVGSNSAVTASGVVPDDHDDMIGLPSEIMVDGDPVEGRIEANEDVDAFYFSAELDKTYTIYTYGLYPEDMKTLLTVHASPGMTDVITSDSNSLNKTSAIIIFENNDLTTVYLTVQHGSPGTGNYKIAVRTTQEADGSATVSTIATDNANDNANDNVDNVTDSSGGGGGGGCFIGVINIFN